MHNAMYCGNDYVVISLLSNGADPTVQNAYSEAVLHLTALDVLVIKFSNTATLIPTWNYYT